MMQDIPVSFLDKSYVALFIFNTMAQKLALCSFY